MESRPLREALSSGVEGILPAYLRGFKVDGTSGQSKISRADSGYPIGGSLYWLELSNYDERLAKLDSCSPPEVSRIMAEVSLEENDCLVPCWTYTG
jgi:hypothetical protein